MIRTLAICVSIALLDGGYLIAQSDGIAPRAGDTESAYGTVELEDISSELASDDDDTTHDPDITEAPSLLELLNELGTGGFPANGSDLMARSLPAEYRDLTFDQYVDFRLLVDAYRLLDSGALTDAAMQFVHGETVLFRSHRAMGAADLIQLAVKVAATAGDNASLDRLAEGAKRIGNMELFDAIQSSRKLAGDSRRSVSDLRVPANRLSVAEYTTLLKLLDDHRRTVMLGFHPDIETLRARVDAAPGLPDQAKRALAAELESLPVDAAESEATAALRKLEAISRPDQGRDIAAAILQGVAQIVSPGNQNNDLGGGTLGGGDLGNGNLGGNLGGGNSGGALGGGGQLLVVPIQGTWNMQGSPPLIFGPGDSETDGWISGPVVHGGTGHRNRYMWKMSSQKEGHLYLDTDFGRQGPIGVRLAGPAEMTWYFGAEQSRLRRIK